LFEEAAGGLELAVEEVEEGEFEQKVREVFACGEELGFDDRLEEGD
jgi:hypothetical protein